MKNKLISILLGIACSCFVAGIIILAVQPAKADQERRGHSTVVVEFSDWPTATMPIIGVTGSGPDAPHIQLGDSFAPWDARLRDLQFTREHQGGLVYIYSR